MHRQTDRQTGDCLGPRLPIVGEVKLGSDRPTYFAFVQALMHAAELVSETQRRRLAREYAEARFQWAENGPDIDLYVIALDAPTAGKFRERSTAATAKIAEGFTASPIASRYLRRIVYLEAKPNGDRLSFELRFGTN